MAITVTHNQGRPAADWEQIVWEAVQNGTFAGPVGDIVTITSGNYSIEFSGAGLTLDGLLSQFTAGTITGIIVKLSGSAVLTITGLNTLFGDMNDGLFEILGVTTGSPPYYTQAFKDAFRPIYDTSNVTATGTVDDDTLLGGLFDDTLNGGTGNDYFDAGAGFNNINGGGGDDFVQSATGADAGTASAGSGNLNGGQNANPDVQGRDHDILAYEVFGVNHPTIGVTINAHIGQTTTNLGAGDVVLDYFYNFEHYVGTQSSDTFIGKTFRDTFTGMNGVDTFIGNGGEDTVDYGLEAELNGTPNGVDVALFNNAGSDTFGDDDILFGIENVRGTDLADTIYGDSNRNRLEGGDSADTIVGLGGNDELSGGDGEDFIDGGDGEDYINGGAGNDTIDAGAGRWDSIQGSAGGDTINGQSGYDELNYSGDRDQAYNGTDFLYINVSSDLGFANDGIGTGTITGNFDGYAFVGFGTTFRNMEQIVGSKGGDFFYAPSGNTITNTNDADTTFGGARGAGGVIHLIGGMGTDEFNIQANTVLIDYDNEKWLHAGFNDDDGRRWGENPGENGVILNMSGSAQSSGVNGTFQGRTYNLLAGKGLDTFGHTETYTLGLTNLISVQLTDTHDLVWTGNSSTYISARAGDDTLFGGSGDDQFNGEEGNDTLNGGDGHDELNGQQGDDVINGDTGNDNVNGDDGEDTISGGDGIDNLNGGEGDDTILGDAGRDNLRGENGDDNLIGGTDNDQVEGGDGNDQVFGGSGNDNVRGDNGEDLVNGDAGDDRAEGGNGLDTINGGDGDDEVNGGNDADRVMGSLGDDRVFGGDGNDILSGDDLLFAFSFPLGAGDIASLGAGVNLSGGNDRLWGDSGNDLMFGGFGHDRMEGGDDNDTIYGGRGDDELRGGSGVDNVNGGDGDDEVDGGSGNDSLNGDNGSDYLYGGSGIDTLTGGAGLDSLEGGTDNDIYVLTSNDAAEDNIYDEGGIDLIKSDQYVDMFRFDTVDNLTITGALAKDSNGNNLNNVMTGNSAVNILEGRNGNDTLFGLAGNDTLRGQNGNDTLYGGAGRDTLDGGSVTNELDVFRYTNKSESGTTAATRDFIFDFDDTKDKINLAALDANESVAGNGTFGVLAIGTATSAVAAGKIGWYQVNAAGTANDRTFLRINTDADATIEMTIELRGLKIISAADFVL